MNVSNILVDNQLSVGYTESSTDESSLRVKGNSLFDGSININGNTTTNQLNVSVLNSDTAIFDNLLCKEKAIFNNGIIVNRSNINQNHIINGDIFLNGTVRTSTSNRNNQIIFNNLSLTTNNSIINGDINVSSGNIIIESGKEIKIGTKNALKYNEKLIIGDDNVSIVFKSNNFNINDNGFVGIGTTSPQAPLHVTNHSTINKTPVYYFENSTTINSSTISPDKVSIYGEHIILGKKVMAFSDKRIKTNIQDLNGSDCLDLFRQLQPKQYQYKDQVNNTPLPEYGYIAQEVNKLIPHATRQDVKYVPNIYEKGTINEKGKLVCNSSELCKDKEGNIYPKLKLYNKTNKEYIVNIINVNGNEIDISPSINEDEVFVYGQEVDDFHELDKNVIWTLASAALQQVDINLQKEIINVSNIKNEVNEKIITINILQEQVNNDTIKFTNLKNDFLVLKKKYEEEKNNVILLTERIVKLEKS